MGDGQLYQQSEGAARVAEAVRGAVGSAPLLLKIGHIVDAGEAEALVRAVSPWASGLAMVNCLSRRVRDETGAVMFAGEPRGIAGIGTRNAALRQIRLFRRVIQDAGLPVRLVGVGGAGTAADVCEYLEAGAQTVHLATAAMLEPEVGLRIRRDLNELL